MTETTQPDAADTTDTTVADVQPDAADSDTEDQDDGKPFDREYVERLRNESKGYRERAKTAEARAEELTGANDRADTYAKALFAARVTATGRLADPTDLPFSAELVDDADALTAAIDALVEAKPHLRSRKPVGDVGQGQTKATTSGPVDLFARARSLM